MFEYAKTNRRELRQRDGVTFKAKLHASKSDEARKYYMILWKFAQRIQSDPILAARLHAVENLIANDEDAEPPGVSEVSSHMGPVEAVPFSSGSHPVVVSHDASAATPAKRHKMAGAEVGAIATNTPHHEGHLSPGVALRLAQSCRKSAASIAALSPTSPAGGVEVAASPWRADTGGFGDETARSSTSDAAEERLLLRAATVLAQTVFKQVRRGIGQTGDPHYLPKACDEKPARNKLDYLRVRHRQGALTTADYRLLARLPHILGPAIYGDVEPHDAGYRWTFAPASVNAHGSVFPTKAAAIADLQTLQRVLYPGWEVVKNRAAHLQQLLLSRLQEKAVNALAQRPALAFARASLKRPSQRLDLRLLCGLPNYGNTCYLNAVTHCIVHARPLRHDIEAQRAGSSFLGDRLKDLLGVYRLPTATLNDIMAPLAAWVAQVIEHAGYAGGVQQDAAECLMHILLGVDGGEMQRRVCGASAAASVEGMILCEIADEAQAHARCKTPI